MHSSEHVNPKRRNGLYATTLAVLLLALSACSSAPDAPDYEVAVKNRATQYTEYGNGHFSAGEYDLALRFFNLALQDNISVDNLPGIAKSYNSITRVYSAAGNLEEARANVALALEFAELADDPEQEMHSYINQGEIELRDGDPDGALEALEQARQIVDDNEDLSNAILLHNLGTLYARRDDLTQAREYLNQALAINTEEQNWQELASNYYMLASLASRENSFDEAYTHASNALEYDKKAEYSPGIAADLQALGRISERRNNDEAAYQYYLRALRVFLTVNDVNGSVSTLDALVGIAGRTGRDDEAIEFAAQRDRIMEAVQ